MHACQQRAASKHPDNECVTLYKNWTTACAESLRGSANYAYVSCLFLSVTQKENWEIMVRISTKFLRLSENVTLTW